MKFLKTALAAPLAVTAIAAAAMTATVPATAAELTAAQVAGDTAPATITPVPSPAPEGSPLWRTIVREHGERVEEVSAFSPAMNRHVPLALIKADRPDAPTLYLLNGGDGGEGTANWVQQTDAIEFYLEKGINVVIPMSGKFSYYTDWIEDVEALGGPQKWETFLTKELPGAVEDYLQANGQRAIAGMSMSATSSLLLAQHNPGFYDAVGSFSGCAETSTPLGYASVALTLDHNNLKGLSFEKMWGARGGEVNRYNDALLNADKLAGTQVYVSNGSGTAGENDMPNGPRFKDYNDVQKAWAMAQTIGLGGIIEGGTNMCTHNLKAKMDSLNIPADFNFHNTGTHSWGYWQQDLRASWPTIARGLGV
ncbi:MULTISPECIES: alpha/beta hydrolase family protein [unclassified Corynebacterium]|uniref:alpha/beta hydrolase n=1 Tax=unclassified Corynebacterium TaxID=2624378 RepID=UPI0029CA4100|nr:MULTISPECIES: alpha/beta hydrolase family protein [unclassified Corynebacterium]WPF66364.1 alpha/beta hydrolase family protein [Corynebacterium sp. 22KM0430]WPF68854.1 alpha/beta hydrolase family protein [Corynebacterium sp. 21KM1197]